MNQELLDDVMHPELEKEPRFTNWLVILILWLGVVTNMLFGLKDDITGIVGGAILLLVVTVVLAARFELGIKLFLGVLFLGVFGLVKFFFFTFELEIFGVPVEIVMLGLLITHYFLNKEVLSSFFSKFDPKPKSEENQQAIFEGKVILFKKRFENKSIEELGQKAENSEMLPEAIQAAKELIKERFGG